MHFGNVLSIIIFKSGMVENIWAAVGLARQHFLFKIYFFFELVSSSWSSIVGQRWTSRLTLGSVLSVKSKSKSGMSKMWAAVAMVSSCTVQKLFLLPFRQPPSWRSVVDDVGRCQHRSISMSTFCENVEVAVGFFVISLETEVLSTSSKSLILHAGCP